MTPRPRRARALSALAAAALATVVALGAASAASAHWTSNTVALSAPLSAAQVGNVTGTTCQNQGLFNVRISWSALSTGPLLPGETWKYRVVTDHDSWNVTPGSTSFDLSASFLSTLLGNSFQVRVLAVHPSEWTSSVATAQAVTVRQTILGIAVRCP